MLLPNDAPGAQSLPLQDCSLPELLLLVGDAERGRKSEALDTIIGRGVQQIYPSLEAAVRDNDNADLRNGAMEVLVKLGGEAVPRLNGLLFDGDEEIRNFSAVMLGDIGSREAVEPLIRALADPDSNVSHSAAEALGKIGDRSALVPLLELLKGDFWLQYPAICAIGELRDYRAVPHLLPLLDNELLRGAVVEALGKAGDHRALYALAGILPFVEQDLARSVAVSMAAISQSLNDEMSYKNRIEAVGQQERLRQLISGRGVERLKSMLQEPGEPESSQAAAMLLGWMGELSAMDGFFQLLGDERNYQVVESAVLALGICAEGKLLGALDHDSAAVRLVALRALRWLGVPCQAAELARLLAQDDEAVQLEVLETLQSFPDESLLPQMKAMLVRGSDALAQQAAQALGRHRLGPVLELFGELAQAPDAGARRRAAMLLGCLKHGGGIENLRLLCMDDDPEVRAELVRSIGKQQVSQAVPLLCRALCDTEEPVREAAVIAAAELGEPMLLDELLALLGSGREDLDYCVIRAVGDMGARDAGSFLVNYLSQGVSRQLEYAIVETLGKLAYKEASELIRRRYLQHGDPDFRRLAVYTLGELADQESLKGVEEAVADAHWSVRIAALRVLGKIGGGRELPLLLKGINDADAMVRKHAITVLGELRNPVTVPELVALLDDPEVGRQAFEALVAFGRAGLPWLHRIMKKNYKADLRERVIDVIGKIADHKSVEPLSELLDDESEIVRLACIDALCHCYDASPLKRLIQVRKNDASAEVRTRAELALKSFAQQEYL
ncbi:HEAT repeat domain-containing protein [Geomonas subterranea]|uniref:HEAT repeat domain-containing protein n=1 Tax=Geomonas subterranea TaxID=2847989 RepID=A0ABX8LK77_9BACT|nr:MULTISPECIES: HEAT repeat domain-containing protein [Geomonas]QXE91034.1 HEAT repeat domain-containing protein [Geomonas subterranea]QXM10880.1 HEAT repeat domain-containing protein [Geomonas subterranea]